MRKSYDDFLLGFSMFSNLHTFPVNMSICFIASMFFVFVNGLLVDFIPDGQTSLGRIHFNVDKGEFGDELLEKQKRGYSVCLIVLISAYSLIGLLGVSVYIFNKRRY